MTFATVVFLTFAVKTAPITEICTRDFTCNSCIPTIRTDLIPHAANKYSKATYQIFIPKWRPLNCAVWQIQHCIWL